VKGATNGIEMESEEDEEEEDDEIFPQIDPPKVRNYLFRHILAVFRIRDVHPRGQKAPDPGSRIRIRNTEL
jgi:hypothetical protein